MVRIFLRTFRQAWCVTDYALRNGLRTRVKGSTLGRDSGVGQCQGDGVGKDWRRNGKGWRGLFADGLPLGNGLDGPEQSIGGGVGDAELFADVPIVLLLLLDVGFKSLDAFLVGQPVL